MTTTLMKAVLNMLNVLIVMEEESCGKHVLHAMGKDMSQIGR